MYSALFKIWQDENRLEDIQSLEDKILDKIRKYVRSLTNLKNKTEDKIAILIIDEEIKNIRFMIENLFELRMNKLFLAIREEKEVKKHYLTANERKFYETAFDLYQKGSDSFYSAAHGTKLKDFDNFFRQYVPIRILKDMSAIVGADLKTYGPFKPEDITVLPKKNAETLIKHKFAAFISVNNENYKKKD